MKKLCRKLALGLLSMALLLGGAAVRTGACMPPFYAFDTWTSSGDISVKAPGRDYRKFLRLSYNEEEISPTSYTVTADGNDTVVTLTRDYLQALDKGTYTFVCYFSGEGEEYRMFGNLAYSLDPPGIEFDNMYANYTLSRITYNGENIDPSYYTVTKDPGWTRVVFKEGAPPLGQSMVAYFTAEYIKEYTTLTVDPQAFPPVEETAADPPVISEEAATSDSSAVSVTLEVSNTAAGAGDGMSRQTGGNPKTDAGIPIPRRLRQFCWL